MSRYESIPFLVKRQKYNVNAESKIQERLGLMIFLNLKGINNEELVCSFSREVAEKLASVEKLYKGLKTDENIMDEKLLQEGYYSAVIEGAETTINIVKGCIDSPFGKSEKMVVNTYKALKFMLDKDLDEDNLLHYWNIIVKDVCENEAVQGDKYREGMVYVGSWNRIVHVPAEPDKIEDLMHSLFDYVEDIKRDGFCDCLVKSIITHFYIAYVHPMCDGNGRLARLVMLSLLESNGYYKVLNLSISKYIVNSLQGYYSSLLASEERLKLDNKTIIDVTPFLMYMLGVFERSMLEYNDITKEVLT